MTATIYAMILGAYLQSPSGTPNPGALVVEVFKTKAQCEAARLEATKVLKEQEADSSGITSYGLVCSEIPLTNTIANKKGS